MMMAVLDRVRRIGLLLLKNDKTCRLGIKSKRAKAGYDGNYLLTVLGFTTRGRKRIDGKFHAVALIQNGNCLTHAPLFYTITCLVHR